MRFSLLLGSPAGYNREQALYSEDVLGFVKETQGEYWQKIPQALPAKFRAVTFNILKCQASLGKGDAQKAPEKACPPHRSLPYQNNGTLS